MGKLQQFDITFEHPHAVIQAGQPVIGQVLVKLSEPMKMNHLSIWFQGRAKVHWTKSKGSGSNRHTKHYRSEEMYFNETLLLFGSSSGSSVTLDVGFHAYSFTLTVPRECPSSFEGEYGYVRYLCKATIDRPWKFDHDTKAAFTVMSLLDLNLEPSNLQIPMEGEETKEVTCCCCVSGTISAKFKINKTGFVPGESIFIDAEIHNNCNSSIDFTKVALKQYTTYYAKSDSWLSAGDMKSRTESDVVAEMKRPEIKPGDSYTWRHEEFRIPGMPPSRLVGCDIISIDYVLKFYANAWDNIEFVNNLTIGTIPLRMAAQTQYGTGFAPVTSQPMPSMPSMPSAPPAESASAGAIDYELPPPSYEQCVKGQREIRDDNDSQYTHGTMSWAPSYPTYNWPSATSSTAYPGPPTELSPLQSAPGDVHVHL